MASIGSLTADLRLESAAFTRDLTRASQAVQTSTNKMRTSFVNLGTAGKSLQTSMVAAGNTMKTAFGLSAVGAIYGVAKAIKSSVDRADELGRMAQSIGIPVDQLSRLEYVAGLADVSVETLGRSVVFLSRNLAKTGQTTKPTIDVMADIADRFATMQDGAQKTALAVQYFGKAGTQLIPLLNEGGVAFRKAMLEADQFGLVVDTKAAKAADEFGDSLEKMGFAFTGLMNQISGRLGGDGGPIGNATRWIQLLTESLKPARTGLDDIADKFAASINAFALKGMPEGTPPKLGADPKGAIGEWETEVVTLKQEVDALAASWTGVGTAVEGMKQITTSAVSGVSSSIADLVVDGTKNFQDLLKSIEKMVVEFLAQQAILAFVKLIVGFGTGGLGFGVAGLGGIFGFNKGGMVPGFASGGPVGTDTVPAWLTPGEFVVNARSARAHRGMLESINADRYASGGMVGGGGGAFGGAVVNNYFHGETVLDEISADRFAIKMARRIDRQEARRRGRRR